MTFADHLNPVLLKSLRQMVRSRMLVISLLAFLGGLLAFTAGALIVGAHAKAGDGGSGGMFVFGAVTAFLFVVSWVSIPVGVFNRLAREREPGRPDLQFTTLIRPSSFADGKALGGTLLAAVFASAALPFLLVAYLMGGVDPASAAGAVLGDVLLAASLSYAAVCFGALSWSPAMKRVLFFLLVYCGGYGVLSVISGISMMYMPHPAGIIGGSAFTWSFFDTPLSVLLGFGGFTLYLRALAIYQLTPANMNRARAIRLTESFFWLATLVPVAVLALTKPDGLVPVLVWTALWILFFSIRLLCAAGTPFGYSRRVLHEVASARMRRFFQFFFFTGGESGLAFCLVSGLATLAVFALFIALATRAPAASRRVFTPSEAREALALCAVFWLYFAFFTLVCRAFWHRFLVGRVRPSRIRLAAFFLFVTANVVPMSFIGLDAERNAGALGFFGNFAGAVYCVSENIPGGLRRHLLLAGVGFVVALALWAPVLVRSVRTFKARR